MSEESAALTAVPSRADMQAAVQRIGEHIRRTPTIRLGKGDLGVDVCITLKLEHLQHTGSFKARGALNAVLSAPVGIPSVVAASGGNHGAAVAWAASRMGVPAMIFVPAFTPQAKQDVIVRYGAQLRLVDGYYGDALQASRDFAHQRGAHLIDAYDALATVAGQATLGAELVTQIPRGEPVFVPCGGGGLFAGVTLALADRNPVFAVEPENAPTLSAAMAAGNPVDVEVSGVAVDSLGARRAGEIALSVARSHDSRVLLVPDADISATRRRLWEDLRLHAEPGGVTGLAAALHHHSVSDERAITVVITGANSSAVA